MSYGSNAMPTAALVLCSASYLEGRIFVQKIKALGRYCVCSGCSSLGRWEGKLYWVLPLDHCIGSNVWKFYLIRTRFALCELVSLVKVFRLVRLELIFFVVQSVDTVGRCTTSIGRTSVFLMPCFVPLGSQSVFRVYSCCIQTQTTAL